MCHGMVTPPLAWASYSSPLGEEIFPYSQSKYYYYNPNNLIALILEYCKPMSWKTNAYLYKDSSC